MAMLYYTFAEGSTRGIFSGRFVFKVHAESERDADALVSDIESSMIANYGRTLAHEKAHHEISSYSPLGKHLVGERFFARLMFGFGRYDAVARYYQRRTLYFALTYDFQEALVDKMMERSGLHENPLNQVIENSSSALNSLYPTRRENSFLKRIFFKLLFFLSGKSYFGKFFCRPAPLFWLKRVFHLAYVNQITFCMLGYFPALEPTESEIVDINQLDKKILQLPTSVKFSRWPFFLHPFNLLGTLASREFGVVLAVSDVENQNRIREATTRTGFGGIFNSAFTPSARDNSLVCFIKAIHRRLNIEGLLKSFGHALNEEKHRKWIEVKLQTEYDTICELYSLAMDECVSDEQKTLIQKAIARYSSPKLYFFSYLQTIFTFNLKFHGIEPIKKIADLSELNEDILIAVEKRDFSILTSEQKMLLSTAGGLFFYHGN